MCWQYRDLDGMRAQLRDDIRASRERGSVPPPVRVGAWALLAAVALLLRAPAAVIVGIAMFEAVVAPLLAAARRPRRELGPLTPWRVPDSYRESPESVPSGLTRR
jgi:hypothetical protein